MVPGAPSPGAPAFELCDVVVRRGGFTILDGITASIPSGSATAVVGASGAGKSTLLRLLNRFADPDSGIVLMDGTDVREYDVLEMRRRVGLLAQQPVALGATAAADIRVGRPDATDEEVRDLLRRVRLGSLPLERPTSGLSGGELQRLALARALAVGPRVLLLDEPTSALDAESAGAVDEAIRGLVADGLTAVIVSHDLRRAAAVADHALVLRAGRLVEQGAPAHLDYLSGGGS